MEKPILFNTEMVQAILEGRKTQTRRIIKNKYENADIQWFRNKYGTRLVYMQNDVEEPIKNPDGTTSHKLRAMEEIKEPYEIGDILYVRETWMIQSMKNFDKKVKFLYKAEPNKELNEVSLTSERYEDLIKYFCKNGWQPSLFMPKTAARIFLKVVGVRAEKLQALDYEEAIREGIKAGYDGWTSVFKDLWDSTVNKKDIDMYGWNSNPWVWVIEFEKIEKC
ncbi:hypothetical protein HYH96_18155 [Clostridium botulinum]|uniref:ASCH domain-containing protein n=1 Tax=Clostridium botulinum (strain Okra / Type B1) TaxID=498213 RepID=B1INM2_CLOBK|nr:hypothetical protein [Clostridium botulinum]EKX78759.1 hypothetical protein CFSAN001628_016999 [Clostridium botulinum CFSAN001628]ACA47038.1 conserved hypothetical protein [Clostridium botulinum B1 str. Okra]MBD5563642.1 hypothetical protein [Clostridium botulinum]MBD5568370.1 hypothetical protein [Clostridium botulinum]MBD5572166.1 hypothetical protein [Clostridium botulinum]